MSEHFKHVFEDGELIEESVVRKFRTTASDGKSYNVTYYNLDMIISLGYRIRSVIATHFRRWATERLKEYIIKGFANYRRWSELTSRPQDINSEAERKGRGKSERVRQGEFSAREGCGSSVLLSNFVVAVEI